ncbi:porin family protein [Vibrio sp. RE86]|uniref:porin family protein n=1 Tax=Vibrio sp. RE86 TaxID=2607605 RepID=UPI0014935498|nr:porin family protein [Vibrio sp. RE86]NOH78691.1 porin family protein [Vibrio sp. RE86]
MNKIFISACVTCAISFTTLANQYPYIGVGYSSVNSDILNSYSVDNSLVGLIVGYQFSQNFAIEARGYGSVSEDEVLGVEHEVERMFGVYGKGHVPIGEYIKVYGTIGYGQLKGAISIPGSTFTDTDSDIQYGIGAAVHKGGPVELQVEWMNLYSSNGIDSTSVGINLVHKL